jgi:YcxB-like protein
MIQAGGEFRFADIRDGTFFILKKILLFFTVLGVIFLGLAGYSSLNSEGGLEGQWFLIEIGLLLIVTVWVSALYKGYRTWKTTPPLKGIIQYQFDDSGIRIETEMSKSEAKWSALTKWKESKRSFVLYAQSSIGHVIPKRFFSSNGDIDGVRELLRANVAAKK